MGKKSNGNVMDMLSIGITILAMSVLVTAYLDCTDLMLKKLEISQLSRQYILKMETEGYLNEQNKQQLLLELKTLGIHNADLDGTTLQPVSYGDTIFLKIKGSINVHMTNSGEDVWNEGVTEKNVQIKEVRQSTAKN